MGDGMLPRDRKFDGLAYPPRADDTERFAAFAHEFLATIVARDAERSSISADGGGRRREGMLPPRWQHLTNEHVSEVIVAMLRDCAEMSVAPPPALADLVAYQLTGRPKAGDVPHPGWPTGERRRPAAWENPRYLDALSYEMQHPGASAREVADEAGVDHKSVLTWRKTDPWRGIRRARGES